MCPFFHFPSRCTKDPADYWQFERGFFFICYVALSLLSSLTFCGMSWFYLIIHLIIHGVVSKLKDCNACPQILPKLKFTELPSVRTMLMENKVKQNWKIQAKNSRPQPSQLNSSPPVSKVKLWPQHDSNANRQDWQLGTSGELFLNK